MKLYDLLVEKIRKYLFFVWIYSRKISRHKTYYFICSYGIGDTLMVCLLMEEFKKRNGDQDVCIITKPSHVGLVKMFNSINQIKVFYTLPNYIESCDYVKPNYPVVMHPSSFYNGSLVDFLGYKKLNLLDVYKIILCLPVVATLDSPKVSSLSRKSAVLKFYKYNLIKGKTIILSPEARSCETLESLFWEKLSSRLIKKGYTVVCNSMNKDNQIKGIKNVEFNLDESIPFCEEAGYVISVRSGFCDLISLSSSELSIIYPDVVWHGGKLFDASSIVSMGLSRNVKEYIYDRDIITKIVSQFNKI